MITILYLHNKTGISGGEQSLLNLWNNLDRSRFTPLLVIPGEGDFAAAARQNGVMVAFCRVPKLVPANLPGLLKALSILLSLCKKHSVRLIHSYTPRNNLLAWATARLRRIPIVWHERNMLWDGERDITNRFLSLPDAVICNSRAVAERFLRNGILPSGVHVIINGVDTSLFKPSPPASGILARWNPGHHKTVGLISNLSRRKNADLFINIAAAVHRTHPDVRFLIIGGEFGDDEAGRSAELQQRIAQAGLTDRLQITGFISNVNEIIPLFDVGVAVTEKEACSRAIIEMMACGKPVAAFSTGGNPELIEHNRTGLLFPYGDSEALTAGIVEMINNSESAARLGAEARKQVVSRFDVAENAEKTMALYSLLLKGRRP